MSCGEQASGGENVFVGVGVLVCVGVIVSVLVGVSVSVGVWVGDGVFVGVWVSDGVMVGAAVSGGIWVGVDDFVTIRAGIGVFTTLCPPPVAGMNGRSSALAMRIYPPPTIIAPMIAVFTMVFIRNLTDFPSEEDPPFGLLGDLPLSPPEDVGGMSKSRLCLV